MSRIWSATARELARRPARAAWAALWIGCAVLALVLARAPATGTGRGPSVTPGGAAMVIYLAPTVDDARAEALAASLGELPGVLSAERVVAVEAARRLRAALGTAEALLDGVPAEALPATVELLLEPGARDVVAASPLLASLRAADLVDGVELSGESADPAQAAADAGLRRSHALALLLAVVLALASVAAVRLALAGDATSHAEAQVARLFGVSPAAWVPVGAWAGLAIGLVGVGLAALGHVVVGEVAALAPLTGGSLTEGGPVALAALALASLGGAVAGARRDAR